MKFPDQTIIIKMDFENEESEEGELESTRVPILNAEPTKYEKVFF